MKTFTFYSDPGHAWLAVSIEDVYAVGLDPDNFSQYSYRNMGFLFLEEDCDAEIFLREWRDVFGDPEIKTVHQENTPIRNYARLTGAKFVL